jgi:parallel beta-helix repeat protein
MRVFTQAALAALILTACTEAPMDPAPPSAASLSATDVIHVPRDFATIQGAVDAATEGSIIQVHAGTYSEEVVITKSGVRLHAEAGVLLDGSAMGGIGIHVMGTAAQPITGIDIAGFEVANFERGIVVQWAEGARVHRNHVHDNLDRTPPLLLGEASGIELVSSLLSEVSGNRVHHNGAGGIQLRVGAARNVVRGNRVYENGTQHAADLNGRGILITGAGTNDNEVLENEVVGNLGRGIEVGRPPGTVPIGGNRIAQNRVHGNQRGGIGLMNAVSGNIVVQNDARDNNLSGLAPCYRCNLVDLSVGGNTWERNLGTFNLTDDCEF